MRLVAVGVELPPDFVMGQAFSKGVPNEEVAALHEGVRANDCAAVQRVGLLEHKTSSSVSIILRSFRDK